MEGEFTARFYSGDSSEKFDNTLSSFTTEFDQVLDFGSEEYEVGVSGLNLNPCNSAENIKGLTRDLVILPQRTAAFSLQQVVKHILHHSVEPKIYDESYFTAFLDENYFFEPKIMEEHFPDAIVAFDSIEAAGGFITVNIDIRDYLKPGESLVNFLPAHQYDNKKSEEEQAKTELYLYAKLTPMTMKQITFILTRYLIYQLRATQVKGDAKIEAHGKMFYAALKTYKNSDDMNTTRRWHLHNVNLIVHRFLNHFVKLIKEENKSIGETSTITPYSRFIHIFSDIIKPQICGPRRSRLIYALPYDTGFRRVYLDLDVTKISYCKLEKKQLKTVSFLILNEYGEKIAFAPNHNSNCITLHFRRVRK